MYCENCGKKLNEGADVCLECGHKVKKDVPVQTNFNVQSIPSEYKPISMWGYFGYEILFMIPFIGWIILIIFAIGHSNVNVKNFARSYFCILIIVAIIMFISVAIVGGTAASMY